MSETITPFGLALGIAIEDGQEAKREVYLKTFDTKTFVVDDSYAQRFADIVDKVKKMWVEDEVAEPVVVVPYSSQVEELKAQLNAERRHREKAYKYVTLGVIVRNHVVSFQRDQIVLTPLNGDRQIFREVNMEKAIDKMIEWFRSVCTHPVTIDDPDCISLKICGRCGDVRD